MKNILSKRKIDALTGKGRYSDGSGLYLIVRESGSKSWAFMWKRQNKRREMGLGSLSGTAPVTLDLARDKANEIRSILARGDDPFLEMGERKSRANSHTFGSVADDFLKVKSAQWKNAKHRAQWAMTLEVYAKSLRDISVDKITTDLVFRCLHPIWSEKQETASRTRGRIEAVLDAARARGLYQGENPARWKGNLDHLLPAVSKLKRGHHAAMNYSELPVFFKKLDSQDGAAALALKFTVLTAARTGEILNAKWSEIDLDASVWTVPADRMKAGKEHRVPLSAAAIDVLNTMRSRRMGEFIFPGQNSRRGLSNMSMSAVLKRLKLQGVTVHGFRSSFRDWAGDRTSFARETVEGCLAHIVGNAVEQAYRRSDALEKRRIVMDAWSGYLTADQTDKVVQLHG